jgi:hypothetical protein
MPVVGFGDAQLQEDAAHVGFDGSFGHVQAGGDRGVGVTFGDDCEHVVFSADQLVERVVAAGVCEQRANDVGIGSGAAVGHAPYGVEEVVGAQHPVPEEVAEAAGGDQGDRVPRLDVARTGSSQVRIGQSQLAGRLGLSSVMVSRHPDVDDGQVWQVLADRVPQRVGVADAEENFVTGLGE